MALEIPSRHITGIRRALDRPSKSVRYQSTGKSSLLDWPSKHHQRLQRSHPEDVTLTTICGAFEPQMDEAAVDRARQIPTIIISAYEDYAPPDDVEPLTTSRELAAHALARKLYWLIPVLLLIAFCCLMLMAVIYLALQDPGRLLTLAERFGFLKGTR